MTGEEPSLLDRLAARCGIEREFYDVSGRHYRAPDETILAILTAMGIGVESAGDMADALTAIDRAPAPQAVRDFAEGHCFSVADAAGAAARPWGLTAPLYGLSTPRDLGIGDFADLARMAEIAAAKGADFLGINPVHALFPRRPDWTSPYSPSSRLALNVLHIAPDEAAEFAASRPAQEHYLSAVQAYSAAPRPDFVDYGAVWAAKAPVLEALFAAFCADAGPRRAAFDAFRARMGERFVRHATFDALWEYFADSGLRFNSWRDWPTPFHDPESAEVGRFTADHGERILFYEYLQFLADEQLSRAQARARAAGMRLGLYLDIAVGVAGQGADMWADRTAFGQDVALGAPPDAFDPNGQNWALAPFNPLALKVRGYRPFADVLKAAMRHAGVVRIDHVLGFARTFWIPDGGLPGTYVRFPLDDLLAVTAAESRKAGAVVIGEDLGNVPEGLRDKLAERGLLSYRVAWFEREHDGTFRHPGTYPGNTIATLTTHDLPTLGGFMAGRDIDWRETLGRQSAEAIAAERDARERDRWALFRLVEFGGHPERLEHLSLAVHRLLAASPAALVAASVEDALGLAEQPNMPGTVAEHPNWCQRLPVGVEELAEDPGLNALAGVMNEGRSDPVRHTPAGS